MTIDFRQYLVRTHGQQVFSEFPAQAFALAPGCPAFHPEDLLAVDRAYQTAQPERVFVFQQRVGGNGDLAATLQATVQCPLGADPVPRVGVVQGFTSF